MAMVAVAKPTSSFSTQGLENAIFLLKEDSSFLLQEDGNKIVIGFGSNFAGQSKNTTNFTAQSKP